MTGGLSFCHFLEKVFEMNMKETVSCLTVAFFASGTPVLADPSVDDLPDITGGVVPVVQYKSHDPFSGSELTSVSEVVYVVKVKNQTGDPLIADSLILIVDNVRGISGKEIFDRVEVQGFDGRMGDGKPFFRIPHTGKELPPFAESQSVTIRVSNPDFLRFFPPGIRVRGLRRSSDESAKNLLENLVQRGLISPEEAVRALESSSSNSP